MLGTYGFLEALFCQFILTRALIDQCESLMHLSIVGIDSRGEFQIAFGIFPIALANVVTRQLHPSLECHIRRGPFGEATGSAGHAGRQRHHENCDDESCCKRWYFGHSHHTIPPH